MGLRSVQRILKSPSTSPHRMRTFQAVERSKTHKKAQGRSASTSTTRSCGSSALGQRRAGSRRSTAGRASPMNTAALRTMAHDSNAMARLCFRLNILDHTILDESETTPHHQVHPLLQRHRGTDPEPKRRSTPSSMTTPPSTPGACHRFPGILAGTPPSPTPHLRSMQQHLHQLTTQRLIVSDPVNDLTTLDRFVAETKMPNRRTSSSGPPSDHVLAAVDAGTALK